MHSKCGSIEDACKIFAAMEERNVFSYSSMIAGFAMHGCAYEALELFHEMVNIGMKPDKVTFIAVLAACSHSKLVDQVVKYLQPWRRNSGFLQELIIMVAW
ncbi:hypothetical protein GQ457_05G012730 [Hibiscus cannabinus]